MSLVKCWYHYFLDRQASNNFAAYLFLSYIGSILATSWFQAGCHPPRRAAQKHPDPENLHLLAEAVAMLGDLPQLPTRNKFDRLVPENFDLDEDDEVMLNPSDG
jgi:hypothetical protein